MLAINIMLTLFGCLKRIYLKFVEFRLSIPIY